MFKSQYVADAILDFCQERGYPVSCRKLQMLMYYAQGWHLATEDEPLFGDPIQAGPQGPIIPPVQTRYKGHADRPIRVFLGDLRVPPDLSHRIEEVWSAYGEISDYELGKLIEGEEPWQQARAGVARDALPYPTISTESMWIYFQDALTVGAGR